MGHAQKVAALHDRQVLAQLENECGCQISQVSNHGNRVLGADKELEELDEKIFTHVVQTQVVEDVVDVSQ